MTPNLIKLGYCSSILSLSNFITVSLDAHGFVSLVSLFCKLLSFLLQGTLEQVLESFAIFLRILSPLEPLENAHLMNCTFEKRSLLYHSKVFRLM